jgi:hypothetical protein
LNSGEVVLNNNIYKLSSTISIDMDSNGTVFVLDGSRHLIAEVNHDFSPTLSYTPEASPSLSVEDSDDIWFGTVSNTLLYAYTDNIEYVTPIKSSSVLVFSNVTNLSYYYIMTANGAFGYVLKSSVSASAKSVPAFTSIKMLHSDGDKIYSYPSKNASSLAVSNDLPMEIISNACNFTGSNVYWYEVKYSVEGIECSGFVMRTRVLEYSTSTGGETNDDINYAKVSVALATSVPIYYLADEQSGVVLSLADGAKVLLLEPIDNSNMFTLVEYDGKQGYILTSYLSEDGGLTNGQLIAILISAFMVVATSLFLLISKNAKKIRKTE